MLSIGFEEDATIKLWDIRDEEIVSKEFVKQKEENGVRGENGPLSENQGKAEQNKEMGEMTNPLRLISSFSLTKNEVTTNAICFSKDGDYFLTCGAFHVTYWPFKRSENSLVVVCFGVIYFC